MQLTCKAAGCNNTRSLKGGLRLHFPIPYFDDNRHEITKRRRRWVQFVLEEFQKRGLYSTFGPLLIKRENTNMKGV